MMTLMMMMMMVMVVVPVVLTLSRAGLRPAQHHLGSSVGQVVEEHLAGCHLVAATWSYQSLGLDHVLR